jgi:TolA-binding protein
MLEVRVTGQGGLVGNGSGNASDVRSVQRRPDPRSESGTMNEPDKQMSDLKKEVVEARNLIIKNDNVLKNIQADVKKVFDRQEQFERRSWLSSVTAYIFFAALSAMGAYMFAAAKGRATTEELASTRAAAHQSDAAAAQIKASQETAERASKRALDIFERLAGEDATRRNEALSELARLDTKKLTPLEQRALEEKAHSLRLEAAREAYESGRAAINRRDWRSADEDLTRYISLTAKPEDQAYLMLGTARHSLRDYKEAVEPLQTFLRNAPNSKQGDYATMMLGEALAESGDVKQAVEVYRNGGNRYGNSQLASVMRTRARRLEHQIKDTPERAADPAAGSDAAR